jgi:hypothetical protein
MESDTTELDSIWAIKDKLTEYNQRKERFLKYAIESNDDELLRFLDKLSLNRPNILWDYLDTNLPDELMILEIKQTF